MNDRSPRRTTPRHAYTTPVRFSAEGDAEVFSGYLRDVSFDGAFVHSFNVPAPGTHLHLRFAAPYQQAPIELLAEVVRRLGPDGAPRAEESGFAVRFLSDTPRPTAPVRPLVERRANARRDFDASLRFQARGPQLLTGFARNLSAGGLFVHTFSLPTPGADVTVRVALPGLAAEHALPVTVVWTRAEEPGLPLEQVGFGARFLSLPLAAVEAIQRHARA